MSKSLSERVAEALAFDAELHSKKEMDLYGEHYEHAEAYRLIIAGKTGAEREYRRLRPLLEALTASQERMEKIVGENE